MIILVADDNALSRELIKGLLEGSGQVADRTTLQVLLLLLERPGQVVTRDEPPRTDLERGDLRRLRARPQRRSKHRTSTLKHGPGTRTPR
jgi:CheY-like chemotaxis protein